MVQKIARDGPGGIISGKYLLKSKDRRFKSLFRDVVLRPPATVSRITTVKSVVLSNHPTTVTVGLTRYSMVKYDLVLSRPEQTITFYSDLMNALSEKAKEAVIAHELAHAWLNEHVRPEQSKEREIEADKIAREWGFGPELDFLDSEAETV